MYTLSSQQIQKYVFHIELLVTTRTVSPRHVDRESSVDSDINPHHRIDAAPIVKQHPDRHDIDR